MSQDSQDYIDRPLPKKIKKEESMSRYYFTSTRLAKKKKVKTERKGEKKQGMTSLGLGVKKMAHIHCL